MPPTSDRQVLLARALALTGVALLCANLYLNRYFFHDDAYISLRYAANLLTAGDLSWNPGDRVEGYTNFLHLIIVAGLLALGIPAVAAAQLVNAAAVAALVAAAMVGLRRMVPGDDQVVVRAAGLATVLAANSLAVWLLGGLEAVLVAAPLAWALIWLLPAFAAKPPPGHGASVAAGIAFALAYLTRPDSLISAAIAGFAVLILGRGPLQQRTVDFLIIGTIPAAVLAAHIAWRYGYYGELLPNTFHAKVGVPWNVRLARVPYYALTATTIFMPAIGLAFVGFAGLVLTRRLSRAITFMTLCIVAHGSYVAWSGGDHMPSARVSLQQLVPATLVLAAALAAIAAPWRQVLAVSVTLLAMAATLFAPVRREDEAAFIGRIIGQHIAATWPARSVVALHTAGSIPFLAPGNTYIDMLGLNDRHIGKRADVPILAPYQLNAGHAKGDGAYVLAREPDYIIAGPAEGGPVEEPWFLTDVELDRLPEFHRCYTLRRVALPYEVPAAARWDKIANPLVFTYYERIC